MYIAAGLSVNAPIATKFISHHFPLIRSAGSLPCLSRTTSSLLPLAHALRIGKECPDLPRYKSIVRRSVATAAMSLNHKRKQSPVNIKDRPTKLLKPEMSSIVNGDRSTEGENEDMSESDGTEDGLMQPPVIATVDTAEWQATIEKVVKNVVSIHFCQTCSFDTDAAISSEATGFVVDAKRGYILTNRHVVGAGPFWGYCIFDNHEEVSSLQRSRIEMRLSKTPVRCLPCLP